MIIYWHKNGKSENKTVKDSSLFITSDQWKNNKKGTREVSLNNEGLDQQLSSTIATKDNNGLEGKEMKDLYDLNLSAISSIEDNNDSLSEDVDMSAFEKREVQNVIKREKENILQTITNNYIMSNLQQAINDQYLFNCLINGFNNNPSNFIHYSFNDIIIHSLDLMQSSISYSFLIQAFPYFSTYEKDIFYNQIIKNNFLYLTKNQYSNEVLIQFILSILNEKLFLDIINIIRGNIVLLCTNAHASKIIYTLLSLGNDVISNTIIDIINDHILAISLSSNGVYMISTLLHNINCRNRTIQVLMNNLGIIIRHDNGHYIIDLLLSLQSNTITQFVINSLLINIPFISPKYHELYFKTLETIFFTCNDPMLLSQMCNVINYNCILRTYLQVNISGKRIMMKAIELLSSSPIL